MGFRLSIKRRCLIVAVLLALLTASTAVDTASAASVFTYGATGDTGGRALSGAKLAGTVNVGLNTTSIVSGSVAISLYNAAGQRVANGALTNSGGRLVAALNTKAFPNGTYRIQAADGTSAQFAIANVATASASIPTPKPVATLPEAEDHRAYMHGVQFVKLGSRHMVIFSSNGYLPKVTGGEWQNDIYYSWFDPQNPAGKLAVKKLVSAPQAQEPASAAVNSKGFLAITAEDAQFSEYLDQTFGVWNANLSPVVPYGAKLMPPQGGHSGHIAASGELFLVSFSDGWVDGGGVDNLGTGDDVFGKIVSADGKTSSMINTSVSEQTRDWWPIVAASDSNWLQVWQRYGTAGEGGGTVLGRTVDKSGKLGPIVSIIPNNKYYYYDVQYLPSLGAYLVIGSQNTSSNAGVAVLVSKTGKVLASRAGLPNTVREGEAAVNDTGNVVVYPTLGSGATVLDIKANSITLRKTVPSIWKWDYMGTDGVFTAPNQVVFATGSQEGLKFIPFNL